MTNRAQEQSGNDISGTSRISSIHASCVRVGKQGVLIRGPSGSGKSRLAFALILAGRSHVLPPTELVADDRVCLKSVSGQLLAKPPENLAGLIEIRGLGIRRMPFADEAIIHLIVDLEAPDGARLPEPTALSTLLEDISVARLPIYSGGDPLQQVLAILLTTPGPT